MPTSDQWVLEQIDRAAREAARALGGPEGAALGRFLAQFFAEVPAGDLAGQASDSLFGAAAAIWRFGGKRQPGQNLARVYNPDLAEHGWTSPHTIVETVVDDGPFLVDSLTNALRRLGLGVHLVIHPVLRVRRDGAGKLTETASAAEAKSETKSGALQESWMQIAITAQSGAERLTRIHHTVTEVLAEVRAAVTDWKAMRARMAETLAAVDADTRADADGLRAETRAFLQWVHDDHFTFLGARDYAIAAEAGANEGADPGLGILRLASAPLFDGAAQGELLPAAGRALLGGSESLWLAKADRISSIHRSVHLDVLGVKIFDAKGRPKSLRLFVGLFTSLAYSLRPSDIPLLRRKVTQAVERSGFLPASHNRKALTHLLETFPRDELFQVGAEELLSLGLGILHVHERPRVAVMARRDELKRFVSTLVYVPRDRYDTELRHRIESLLSEAYGGEVTDHYIQVDDSPLARLHLIVRTRSGAPQTVAIEALEARIVEASRSWSDRLQEAMVAVAGEERGQALFQRYQAAFPAGYRERMGARAAVVDAEAIEAALTGEGIGLALYRPLEAAENELRFKLFRRERPVALSDVLPMLENMGLKVVDEVPHAIHPEGAARVMLHDFGLLAAGPVNLGAARGRFEDAFRKVWDGEAESDGFNRLVLAADLTWRQVMVLRAYAKYLKQTGIPFSQSSLEKALAAYPVIAALLVALFETRFDPARKDREDAVRGLTSDIGARLEAVENATDDRILRRFLNAIEASLRTNYYQPGKGYLSFKLDSGAIDGLPLPRPWREIFVYSPRVEAIHLRGGKVARGGIRWSDRPDDFRTEILGLMKAQMVKNAVIVPIGSKGGFIVKRPPSEGGRDAFMAEGIDCYKILMRGLLDITDNLKGDAVIPPQDVVRHDGDDPYLVVAADKGTATFSDIANGVSREYGFWLDDAFASGGSAGYDHKKMGITARGAWESVKRHFRELGRDTQSQDFTVVGVGDMSGDVFGNGMLLSRHIKLVAAFDHRHILLDPDPDPAASFAERERMFVLPRSSWEDYDKSKLSKGGGIFRRDAKSIPLSAEIKNRFAIKADSLTPSELMQILLRADIDLLWFGGIGTFIRATSESDAQVGDRANDAVRVTASELRCKVVGEGANLGVTPRARIEASLRGVKLNADFIDNSAGVDCSDHEVNIKILMGAVVDGGDLTLKQRDKLLAEMTDEVGHLVLADNYAQTQAISVTEAQGVGLLDLQSRLMRRLEREVNLNRAVEYLPDDEALAERAAAGKGLARSENALLMSNAKIWLYNALLASDLPDDPRLENDLVTYFPTPLRERFAGPIGSHRLRREIIATRVTNSLINRVGGTFVLQVMEETGMSAPDVARAYIVTRDAFRLREVWKAIEGLDGRVDPAVQIAMILEANRLVERGTLWFLRNLPQPIDMTATVTAFGEGIASLAGVLDRVLGADARGGLDARAKHLVAQGVPEDLARRVGGLLILVSACDIVRLARERHLEVGDIAALYFAVGPRFGLGWMRQSAERLDVASHWQKLAVTALIEEFYRHQQIMTRAVLDMAGKERSIDEAINGWRQARIAEAERTEALIGELRGSDSVDLAMLAVASRQLRRLCEAAN